jgi:hypothetical protein
LLVLQGLVCYLLIEVDHAGGQRLELRMPVHDLLRLARIGEDLLQIIDIKFGGL